MRLSKLNVLSYAQGFTHFVYTGDEPRDVILSEGFSDGARGIFEHDDMIVFPRARMVCFVDVSPDHVALVPMPFPAR